MRRISHRRSSLLSVTMSLNDGKPKATCNIPQYFQRLTDSYGGPHQIEDMENSIEVIENYLKAHQEEASTFDYSAVEKFKKWIEKKKEESRSAPKRIDTSIKSLEKPEEKTKIFGESTEIFISIHPRLAFHVMSHFIFLGLPVQEKINQIETTLTAPSIVSSIPISNLHSLADEFIKFCARRLNKFSLTTPVKTEDYLKNYFIYLNLTLTLQENKREDFLESILFYREHLSSDKFYQYTYFALELCCRQTLTEGDGFSLFHEFSAIKFPLEFFKKNLPFALKHIEALCVLINYALNNPPIDTLSEIACENYIIANDLQEYYQSQLNKRDLTSTERQVFAFFYYTKARLSYHLFSLFEAIAFTSKRYSTIPKDPIAALKEFNAFHPEHKYPVTEWIKKISQQKILRCAKKSKQIMPPQYGSYVHLTYEEQKTNYLALKESSLAVVKKYQTDCLNNIIRIFSPLKECKDALAGLEIAIRKICEWDTDSASYSLCVDLIEIYTIFAMNDVDKLKEFRSRLLPKEEKKEESSKSLPAPVIFNNSTPARAKRAPSSTVKEVVEQDEKKKMEALNAAPSVEQKQSSSQKKKKKKKKKIKASSASSSSSSATASAPTTTAASSPSSVVIQESKLPLSTNGISIPIKQKKLLKPGQGIPAEVFFNHLLEQNDAENLFKFMQNSPLSIVNGKYVGGVHLDGSVVLRAAIYCLTSEYPPFKPRDIDFFYSMRQFSMGIASWLRQKQFEYQTSVKRVFTKYACTDLKSPEGKPVPSELTVVPESAESQPRLNSLPISDIHVVADRDANQCYFIGLTEELQRDIIAKVFPVNVPSLEPSASRETFFLMRFANYYNKLVIQSEWKVDERVRSVLKVDEFLKPYLNKIKRQSELDFQKEISRLIDFHQKECLMGDEKGTKRLVRDVLQPCILAFFSILISPEKTDSMNYAPLLTTHFLSIFNEKKIPIKTEEQSYFEWLREIIKKISSPDSSDLSKLINLCCAEIKPSDSPVVTRGLFKPPTVSVGAHPEASNTSSVSISSRSSLSSH